MPETKAKEKAEEKDAPEQHHAGEDITPGYHDAPVVVYDEPESSWSPSTNSYPAVPEQVGELEPKLVSEAPNVFGEAAEDPVILTDVEGIPEAAQEAIKEREEAQKEAKKVAEERDNKQEEGENTSAKESLEGDQPVNKKADSK